MPYISFVLLQLPIMGVGLTRICGGMFEICLISDCGAKAHAAFIESYRSGKTPDYDAEIQ